MKLVAISLLLVAFLVAFPSEVGSDSGPRNGSDIVAIPENLKWSDVTSMPPGAKISVIEGDLKTGGPFTFRLKFPADYKVAVHTHPVTERVTVLSGAFHLGFGEKFDPEKTKRLAPGSVAIMPSGTKMFAFTKEETVIQLHGVGPWGITYLNPGDDPRRK